MYGHALRNMSPAGAYRGRGTISLFCRGSDDRERTTAGDDSRKLDVGGTTSAAASDTTDGGATEVTADDEFTVHSGTDDNEGLQNNGAATGATDDEKGASSRGMFSTKADGQSIRSESCTAVYSSLLTIISG